MTLIEELYRIVEVLPMIENQRRVILAAAKKIKELEAQLDLIEMDRDRE